MAPARRPTRQDRGQVTRALDATASWQQPSAASTESLQNAERTDPGLGARGHRRPGPGRAHHLRQPRGSGHDGLHRRGIARSADSDAHPVPGLGRRVVLARGWHQLSDRVRERAHGRRWAHRGVRRHVPGHQSAPGSGADEGRAHLRRQSRVAHAAHLDPQRPWPARRGRAGRGARPRASACSRLRSKTPTV